MIEWLLINGGNIVKLESWIPWNLLMRQIAFMTPPLTPYPSLSLMQSAVELLRQWCSMGGWHDEQALAGRSTGFKQIGDTQLLACITTSPYQKT